MSNVQMHKLVFKTLLLFNMKFIEIGSFESQSPIFSDFLGLNQLLTSLCFTYFHLLWVHTQNPGRCEQKKEIICKHILCCTG